MTITFFVGCPVKRRQIKPDLWSLRACQDHRCALCKGPKFSRPIEFSYGGVRSTQIFRSFGMIFFIKGVNTTKNFPLNRLNRSILPKLFKVAQNCPKIPTDEKIKFSIARKSKRKFFREVTLLGISR